MAVGAGSFNFFLQSLTAIHLLSIYRKIYSGVVDIVTSPRPLATPLPQQERDTRKRVYRRVSISARTGTILSFERAVLVGLVSLTEHLPKGTDYLYKHFH